ncbi:MAG: mechanosensitive ion channel family protein [Okeania sp. SIO3I5]|uniref:mechanosensitive ion channel family protein n=1 Tax=Okeania sp. SIO3I5 TaxID=2607805 RepID=UPI0013BCB5E8|nr:mechanosensitive ion channel family protein [Okeania sp. SIO3I5]NEQ40118.1 mechanosensitive ion channel family protein [Okeania sp. SIO3I5]
MKKTFRQTIKFIIISILSLTLSLTCSPKSLGQIPLFISGSDSQNPQLTSKPWDLHKAIRCGKFWCSEVHFIDGDVKQGLTADLTLAAPQDINSSNVEIIQQLEQRSQLIVRFFKQIINSIIEQQTESEVPYRPDWEFWLPTTEKTLHPLTPKVEVGIKNQQTVIYLPEQPELDTIVTITDPDAKANGKKIEELAEIWRNNIRTSFSYILWGHELSLQHPGWRAKISVAIILLVLALIWLSHLIRNFLKKQNNQLRQQLSQLTESMATETEVKTVIESEVPSSKIEENISNTEEFSGTIKPKKEIVRQDNVSVQPSLEIAPPLSSQKNPFHFIRRLAKKTQLLALETSISQAKFFLQRQNLMKQRQNLYQLFLRLMLIFQFLFLSLGLIGIVFTFRETRFLSVYLFEQMLVIIILWLGLSLIDKLGGILIDSLLHHWAKEGQLLYPKSNRYTLRVDTYSQALKKAITFLTIFFGIYLSLFLLGVNLGVLASAGVFAVAVAFLSRSILEDLLNGILILSSDRYAMGDVIDVGGGMSGTVEDINLFITSLRNLDGQLMAIPNRRIESVINMTKYWSRVNFMIKIAGNEDIDRAIEVMIQVANQLQSESQWNQHFLEPVEVLGVDEVSHEGILIHLLIKTPPGQHWPLGREFRRRVKKAFDEAGISLGIPYHQVSIVQSDKADNNNQLFVNFNSKKDSNL